MPRFQQQLPGRASSGNGETLQREAMAGCSAAGHSQLGLSAAGHSQLGLSTACFTYSTTRPWNSLLINPPKLIPINTCWIFFILHILPIYDLKLMFM